MKKIFGLLLVASFFVAGTASAQMGMMNYSAQSNATTTQSGQGSTTISAALHDIYSSQNVTSQSQLNCSRVSDTQFEKLGDAVMGYGITEQQHTAMENMMGGEGSATLTQAHINLGRSYLGCWAGYNSGPMRMMGSYAQTGTNNGYRGMMGDYSWFGWITMILLWALLVLGIIALIRFLRKTK